MLSYSMQAACQMLSTIATLRGAQKVQKCLIHARVKMQQQCTSTPWSEKASSMAMPPLPTTAMRLAWRMRRARLSTVSLSLSTSTCSPSATACTERT